MNLFIYSISLPAKYIFRHKPDQVDNRVSHTNLPGTPISFHIWSINLFDILICAVAQCYLQFKLIAAAGQMSDIYTFRRATPLSALSVTVR